MMLPSRLVPLLLSVLALGAPLSVPQDDSRPGYTDTPMIPGQAWRVHDKARPYPPVVEPGGAPGAAPSDAVVLFDGGGLAGWEGGRWSVVDGALEVGRGSLSSKATFGNCQLHIEWRAPADVSGEGQGRGNSGVFLMGRYEVQVLDSFANATYADGQAAALYGQFPPQVNACRAPGAWQSYDILFRAPRFDGEDLLSPAVVTVLHNGVVVHHARELIGQTTHRAVARYGSHESRGPIVLQDHGSPVAFRNIWVRAL